MPVKAPVSTTMVSDRKPMKWIRSTRRPNLKGGMTVYAAAWRKNRPNCPSPWTISRLRRPSAAMGRSGGGQISDPGVENIARY